MADKTFISATLSSADVNTYLSHTGNAYNSWTPTITQGVPVSCSVDLGAHHKTGRRIHGYCRLTVSSTGTAGNQVVLSLPTNWAGGVSGIPIGTAFLTDLTANAIYRAQVITLTATTCYLLDVAPTAAQAGAGDATVGSGANTFSAALAAGDIIAMSIDFEST